MPSERSIENLSSNKNRIRERAFYIAACGSIALLATITGCDGDTTPPRPAPQNEKPAPTSIADSIDSDGDGILNTKDRLPNIADAPDVDNDGLVNSQDLLYPYDPLNGATSTQPLPNTTSVPIPASPNTLPCTRYTKPDSDGDGIPDHCDYFIDSKDSDGDGLLDRDDTWPQTADRDNDGIPDGQDREPDVNQKREQEKRDAERREQQRQEQKRLEEKRLEEKRLEDQRRRDTYGY